MFTIGKKYRIKGKDEYFYRKYGTYSPTFILEGTDVQIWGCDWKTMTIDGNIAAMLYEMREASSLPGRVFGGKINGNSELINEREIEL